MTHHRLPSESLSANVDWLCEFFKCDRRIATFLLWDVAFKVGTDRHHWITEEHAREYIMNHA